MNLTNSEASKIKQRSVHEVHNFWSRISLSDTNQYDWFYRPVHTNIHTSTLTEKSSTWQKSPVRANPVARTTQRYSSAEGARLILFTIRAGWTADFSNWDSNPLFLKPLFLPLFHWVTNPLKAFDSLWKQLDWVAWSSCLPFVAWLRQRQFLSVWAWSTSETSAIGGRSV